MDKEQIEVIIDNLRVIYGDLLPSNDRVVDQWHKVLMVYSFDQINEAAYEFMSTSSQYPPKPGQLKAIADRKVGTNQSSAVSMVDHLRAEMRYLTDQFYLHNEIDESRWERLILQFRNSDRPYAAVHASTVYERMRAAA